MFLSHLQGSLFGKLAIITWIKDDAFARLTIRSLCLALLRSSLIFLF